MSRNPIAANLRIHRPKRIETLKPEDEPSCWMCGAPGVWKLYTDEYGDLRCSCGERANI